MTNIDKVIKELEDIRNRCDKAILELKQIKLEQDIDQKPFNTKGDYDNFYRCKNCVNYRYSHTGKRDGEYGICSIKEEKAHPGDSMWRYTILANRCACKQFCEKLNDVEE